MVQNSTTEVVKELVTERKRQGMTQQELADITGIQPPNLARIESGKHIPTLVVLEKYVSALGKHIEIKVCDD
ncbi:helix-turn-helix domain-containing protein [Laedolimicola intestinihominis]|uniref:Helix-turn-helix transcriptional regulator n=1 Tax=Laedolimicola intestinihominis TaxID=3133166 RepID=A0ABV1FGB3_9FIRM